MKEPHEKRYQELVKELSELGSISQGSVAYYPPRSWRWAFKIKGKTSCVALSEEQAKEMQIAIENHKKLEQIVSEMREITQTKILETMPGVTRRKPLSQIPKAR